jgi:hypothetical protein
MKLNAHHHPVPVTNAWILTYIFKDFEKALGEEGEIYVTTTTAAAAAAATTASS